MSWGTPRHFLDYMDGMEGATAEIDSAEDTTVYYGGKRQINPTY